MAAQYREGEAHLLITSPPYPGLRGFSLTGEDYLSFLEERLGAWVQVLDPVRGVLVLNIGTFPRREGFFDLSLLDVPRRIEALGVRMIDFYVWDKLNSPPSGNQRRHDRSEWESVFVFARSSGYIFNPVRKAYSAKTVGKARTGMRQADVSGGMAGGHDRLHEAGARMGNVLRLSSSGDQGRPRVKGGSFPRGLVSRFVQQYTEVGDVVVDPFVGAGTSLVVARGMGRHAIGVDTSGEAVGVAAEWSGLPVKGLSAEVNL